MIRDLLAFALGTMVGSFLNVCIYRLPKAESIVFPGSHCGRCGKPVHWHDNIPVVSYLALGGRCRDCGGRFSAQYLCVEILTGALFVFYYRYFGMSATGITFLIFTLALLTQGVIDFHHKIIPDVITLPGIVAGLAASCLIPAICGAEFWWEGLRASAVGAVAGGGFLFLVAVVAEFILKKEAMGGGDVKLLAMIGAFLGLVGVAWVLLAASLLGSVAGIYFRFIKREEEIPFGPFLGLAAALYIFLGESSINWYFSLFRR